MKIISNWERGFTLVELLTVTVVTVTISVLISMIITFALRGTNKTNSVDEVRKNGNYALLQISKIIEYAKSFDGVSTDGVSYDYNCVQIPVQAPSPSPTPLHYSHLRMANFDGDKTVFSCVPAIQTTPATIASNGASLIDTNSVSLDSNSCFFTCLQQRITDVPTIGVNFGLSKKTSSTLFENKSSIPFQTSVTVRNLGR